MRNITLIRGARQLLTLHGPSGARRGADLGNLGIIQDGAILIADGLIREIGPTRRVENLAGARQADEIDASGRVVMPGLIDSHTRLVSGPVRSSDHVRAMKELSPRTLERVALAALEQAVRHGTTAIEANSGEMKSLRVHSKLQKRSIPLLSTFFLSRVTSEMEPIDEYLQWVCGHLLPLIKRGKLATFADILCEPDAFTPARSRQFLTAAQRLGFGLKVQGGIEASSSAISLAVELRAISVGGCIEPSNQDVAALAQSAVIATLLPTTPFFLGTDRYPPARALIESGAAVALASNFNAETSPSQNMQMAIALACMRMAMTPAEAISAATINAAHALRCGSMAGSLEIGKSADLLILAIPDYRELPYHFGVHLVELVMKAGRVLVERSEVKWPAN